MPVFAQCPYCGLTFRSNALDFGPGAQVSLSGNQETCPRCGRFARIMDGDFRFGPGNAMTMLDGPAWTRDMLGRITAAEARRLRTAVTWAQRELSDRPEHEDVVREKIDRVVEREAPWLGQFIDKIATQRNANLTQILGFILALLVFLGFNAQQDTPQPAEKPVTDEQLRSLFEEYFSDDDEPDSPNGTAPAEDVESPGDAND